MDIARSAKIQTLSKSQQGCRLYRRSISARHANKRKPPAALLSSSP
jgi:hypothetical protein